jgi:hypothetical protein
VETDTLKGKKKMDRVKVVQSNSTETAKMQTAENGNYLKWELFRSVLKVTKYNNA